METRIVKLNGRILTGSRIRGFKREIVAITVDAEYATVHFSTGKACQYGIGDASRLMEWGAANEYAMIDTRVQPSDFDELSAIDTAPTHPDPEGYELAQLELRLGY